MSERPRALGDTRIEGYRVVSPEGAQDFACPLCPQRGFCLCAESAWSAHKRVIRTVGGRVRILRLPDLAKLAEHNGMAASGAKGWNGEVDREDDGPVLDDEGAGPEPELDDEREQDVEEEES